jgi:guanine deaminase
MIDPGELMRLAILKAREGIAAGQSPFGCAIARGDDLLAVTHNLVRATTDITAHAEIVAIRNACQRSGQIHLCDCIVASTCEPCPMCMSALHWARVETVFYGAEIADASIAGFNELSVSAGQLVTLGDSSVKLVNGMMRQECQELFHEWLQHPDRVVY